jgi:hypothetical protein
LTAKESFADRQFRRRFYEEQLLQEAPRLLSAMDRCPISLTSGCLDREYWAWATKDFANMDMQRGLLVLAYLYRTMFEGNCYHQDRALLSWIAAGVRFWVRGQSHSGAFDHLYVREDSWMATAFTLTDLSETYALLGEEFDETAKTPWLRAMVRAGEFLLRYDELHGFISNHRAGAAAGLLRLSQLTNRTDFAKRARQLMDEVRSRQSPEGWYLEYEGADPGYQTLDTQYQAKYFLRQGSGAEVPKSVLRSLEFLSYFMHPDGSIGGEYGSRGCPHFFPGGIEVFAEYSPTAESIARLGAWGLATGCSAGLADADPRNEVPLATSYVLAHQALSRGEQYESVPLPVEQMLERYFRQAGMFVRSDERFFTIFGASRGGVVKVFDKQQALLTFASCGYEGRTTRGRPVTTHLWTSQPEMRVEPPIEDGVNTAAPTRRVQVDAPFYDFREDRVMTPVRLLFFRFFTLTVGRVRPLSDWVRRNLIIRRFLKARSLVRARLQRCLSFDDNGVSVADEIRVDPRWPLKSLREHGFLATVYMASARYFRQQDLSQVWTADDLAGLIVEQRLARCRVILWSSERGQAQAHHSAVVNGESGTFPTEPLDSEKPHTDTQNSTSYGGREMRKDAPRA